MSDDDLEQRVTSALDRARRAEQRLDFLERAGELGIPIDIATQMGVMSDEALSAWKDRFDQHVAAIAAARLAEIDAGGWQRRHEPGPPVLGEPDADRFNRWLHNGFRRP